MSDKEFDKQFRDKFEDFEFEPSSSMWTKIDGDLSSLERKRLPWFSIAAASMTAVLAAGIWFAPHKEPMKLYGKVKMEQGSEKAGEVQAAEVDWAEASATDIKLVEIEPEHVKRARRSITKTGAKVDRTIEPVIAFQRTEEMSKVAEIQQLKNESVPFAAANAEFLARESLHENILAFNPLPEDTTSEKSKRRIRSVGDLVNFVVGKVDKRKNKLIEFSKDEEGEEISGLNLGLLQYRTRNN